MGLSMVFTSEPNNWNGALKIAPMGFWFELKSFVGFAAVEFAAPARPPSPKISPTFGAPSQNIAWNNWNRIELNVSNYSMNLDVWTYQTNCQHSAGHNFRWKHFDYFAKIFSFNLSSYARRPLVIDELFFTKWHSTNFIYTFSGGKFQWIPKIIQMSSWKCVWMNVNLLIHTSHYNLYNWLISNRFSALSVAHSVARSL